MNLETSLADLLGQAISERAFPGAVLAVGSVAGTRCVLAAGHHTYESGRATRPDDLFDLASLTKVVGTASIAMRLHGRGLLDPAAPVADLLPDFAGPEPARREVTVAHLLAHCSGLPAWRPFHRECVGTPEERRLQVLRSPLAYAPGERSEYSDIGMMAMGLLLEELTATPLAELVQREVCRPLGMREIQYTPPPVLAPRCLPTECMADGIPLQGVVHDENARWLGGVAGHAGLFAPAEDLARLAACLLEGGGNAFAPETMRLFTRPAGLVPGSTRCLGWHGIEEQCSGGRFLGPGSYGHTGFTGTSIWLDPDHDLFVVLLTNAVHPRREAKANGFFPWRRRLHEAVYAALGLATDI